MSDVVMTAIYTVCSVCLYIIYNSICTPLAAAERVCQVDR